MEFRSRPTADGILAAQKTACATSYGLFMLRTLGDADVTPFLRQILFSVHAGRVRCQNKAETLFLNPTRVYFSRSALWRRPRLVNELLRSGGLGNRLLQPSWTGSRCFILIEPPEPAFLPEQQVDAPALRSRKTARDAVFASQI